MPHNEQVAALRFAHQQLRGIPFQLNAATRNARRLTALVEVGQQCLCLRIGSFEHGLIPFRLERRAADRRGLRMRKPRQIDDRYAQQLAPCSAAQASASSIAARLNFVPFTPTTMRLSMT